MNLADITQGPIWPAYILIAILFIIALILLLNPKKASEDIKKKEDNIANRIFGIGILLIALLMFFTTIFRNILPTNFTYITILIIFIIALIIIFSTSLIYRNRR